MPILDLQRRQRELGRIRLGDRGGKGQPQRLDHFRLTSPARHLLEEAAALWGGEVREWAGSPSEGQYELYTATDTLPIVMPPGREPISQWFEQWTGGGCTHRCDGVRNHISDSPCSCDPDDRACRATTRVNVMLPDLPDVGVWRLESHGLNAAIELPGTIEVIAMASAAGRFLSGRLRIEHRTSKRNGETRRFIVPVIDLDVTMRQMMSGEAPDHEARALTAGQERSLPPGPREPAGEAPPASPGRPAVITEAQKRRMFAIAREHSVPAATVKAIVTDLTGQESSAGIPRDRYDSVIEAIQAHAGGQEVLGG